MSGEPLAYFITFRTYGTWLHGDERGSTDRRHNAPGEPFLPRDDFRSLFAARRLSAIPFEMDFAARASVDASVRQTCAARGWPLHALNVRTNHIHLVASAPVAPERVMEAVKAWATRRLREAGLTATGAPVWARHGSTRYLWTDGDLEAAWGYVVNGQDHPDR